MAKVIAYLNNLRSRLMRRSASGPTNLTGEEGKLRNTAAINSRRARRYARVIVGGLLFEVIILLVYSAQKSWHETAFLIISALIIAAGVWGEDRHAHEADSANNELQRISDEKIAEANVRAAEAQLRAEQLRRAMSWRQLNDERSDEELGRAREKATVELLYVDDDPEILPFCGRFTNSDRQRRLANYLPKSCSIQTQRRRASIAGILRRTANRRHKSNWGDYWDALIRGRQ